MNAARKRAFINQLEGICGKTQVLHSQADRFVYGYDSSVFRGSEVLAVALPNSAEQVSALVHCARKAEVSFIARGSGTGINGGALPTSPSLIIALARMDRIVTLDPANRLAVVEPGVINQQLKEHLAEQGFGFNYVPDPGSQVVSTIGGNVGNNAGGMHCLKYGVTSNHILGLQVVLPNGEIVELGGPAAARPGPDLTGLLVGSEGTLGVVTRITLRILPLPERVVTQLVLFPSVDAAARAVSGIMAAGILPAALELMDHKMMGMVDRFVHVGFPAGAGACLIIEMDGLSDGMDEELRRVGEVCEANAALEIKTAKTEAEAQNLWLSRRAAYGSMARLSSTVYVMDVTVPRNLLAEANRGINEICAARNLDVVTLAHAGDGNLHPLIPFDRNDETSTKAALSAHREIMALCVAMGGSITGEHGVGVEKQQEIELMYGQDELAGMFTLKLALDPGDLCNPRKIFPLSLFDAHTPAPPPGDAGKVTLAAQLNARLGATIAVDGPEALDSHAIAGVRPRAVVFPESSAQIASLLSLAAEQALALLTWGAGTSLPLGPPPQRYDLALDLSPLASLLEHDVENLTVTAQAGIRMGELNRQLATRQQGLMLTPAVAAESLGGVLASNRLVWRRLLYGDLRDQLLGLEVALPNGKLARYGRKVIKDVAGYDMGRLFIGSHGQYGIVTEATFKLFALPDGHCFLCAGFDAGEALGKSAAALYASRLLPASLTLFNAGAAAEFGLRNRFALPAVDWLLMAGFEGRAPTLRRQEREATALLNNHGAKFVHKTTALTAPPEAILTGKGILKTQSLESPLPGAPLEAPAAALEPFLILRAGDQPGRLAASLSQWQAESARLGMTLHAVAEYTGAVAQLMLKGDQSILQAQAPKFIGSLRAELARRRGYLAVEQAGPRLWEGLHPWGGMADELALMHHLKTSYDPNAVLGPGRFFPI